jgi:hypothetical protein
MPKELKEKEKQVNTQVAIKPEPNRFETQPFTATYATKV